MSKLKPNLKTTSKKSEAKLGSNLLNLSYEEARARLIEIIKAKSLFDGDCVLPSGQITSHYLDLKESLLGAEGSFLAAVTILHNMRDEVQFLGGLTDSVYSLAIATSQLAFMRGQEIDTFLLRENTSARRKGLSKWIEGPLKPCTKVCLIQDEVVDGGKVIEMVRKLQEEADSEIVQVIAVVDRLDGARSRLQDYGVDYTSIITMQDILGPALARR